METITSFFQYVWSQIKMMEFTDVLDILLLSLILFFVYRFMRERRAGKLAIGIVFLMCILIISQTFHMHAINFVLGNVMQVGILALIIVFQPELRAGLEKFASQPLNSLKSIGDTKKDNATLEMIKNVSEAADTMSRSKTGALIIIENTTKVGDFAKNGVIIDADVNKHLITNIFFNKAPLHDGAVIIASNRIHAAGCLLPLSQDTGIDQALGTRHRAAIGASEVCDAVVVVVSEETGTISIAHNGKLERDFNSLTLNQRMSEILLTEKAPIGRFKFGKGLKKNSTSARENTNEGDGNEE